MTIEDLKKNNQRKIYAIIATAMTLTQVDAQIFQKIRGVYLFGSVATGTATEESDVDVFFDVDIPLKSQTALRRKLQTAYEDFQISQEGLKFKLIRVSNNFSPIAGKLEEWTDLQKTIASSGIQLYGPARITIAKGEPWLIYSWSRIPPKKRGGFLNSIYGVRIGKKRYEGLITRCNGLKIGKSAAAIPKATGARFEELIAKHGIEYTVREFYR